MEVLLSGSALAAINKLQYALGAVNTWMGDCLQTGSSYRYLTSHPGQLSLSSLQGRLIEYHLFWLGLGGACSLVSGGR